jgi:prepilin-type N-terminal cleavage/methylation domain-containing protein/prepilin-type processing-associated H-X9-DG protein
MDCRTERGLTLMELLVVISVIAILAALLLPALSITKKKARQTVCMNHLRQINLGVRMYSNDASDRLPTPGAETTATNRTLLYSGYKELVKDYLGLKGASSQSRSMFTCPADVFYPSFFQTNSAPAYNVRQSLHQLPLLDFSSYVFNGGDNTIRRKGRDTWKEVGLNGHTFSSVSRPGRTILVCEASATIPWSWHNPVLDKLQYGDAKNIVSFVDGHVAGVKIFWDGRRLSNGAFLFAFNYDPPAHYDYQWSAD